MTQRVDWNAEDYHVVSRPHEVWGARVLDRVPREGVRVAIDAGCGTGKITRELLDRLPDTIVYALDVSAPMLAVAERELAAYGGRVRFRQADLASVAPADIGTTADLIFSTATFHWVKDHDLLFRNLYDLLNPGGWLIAQCGGGPNIAILCRRMTELMAGAAIRILLQRLGRPVVLRHGRGDRWPAQCRRLRRRPDRCRAAPGADGERGGIPLLHHHGRNPRSTRPPTGPGDERRLRRRPHRARRDRSPGLRARLLASQHAGPPPVAAPEPGK